MSVQDQITKLNAGWYNVVSNAMGLDPTTFLLAQGTLGLQTTSSAGLFQMSDAVPPSASVAFFDSSGTSMRSSAYQGLLGALLPETSTSLAAVLGDMYTNWVSYRNSWFVKNPDSTLTQEELFEQWANQRLDPGKTSQAINTYKQAANSPLNQALDALNAVDAKQEFTASDGTSYKLFRYSATNADAVSAINTGSSATIKYDSKTADTTLKRTTAKGAASGFYDIFSGGVAASFDKLNTTAASSEFKIDGTIGKFATLATAPISWFNSGEYTRAYNGKNDNSIWDPQSNAGTWDSFFDQSDGSLARKVSQLILVSDYHITVTSMASYSSEDYQKITAEANFGVWPFFSARASATSTQRFTHNEDGSLSVTHTLNKGLIQIWGVNVLDAPK